MSDLNLKYRLLGMLLIVFCGTTWAWMLGFLSYILNVGMTANVSQWINPGFLAFPAIFSFFAGVVGFLFILGVFPLSSLDKGDAP